MRRIVQILVCAAVLALSSTAAAQWNEQVLYSFQGGTDGEYPLGRIVFDASGNLYGVTQAGGSYTCTSGYCGIVYQLVPPAQPGNPWTENILHVFQGHTTGDASDPLGGLLIDASGNLYGSTAGGGTGDCELLGTFPGCGAIYEISPPAEKGGAWTETVLYSFQGGSDGYVPYGDLVSDSAGNLYGSTWHGGGYGIYCGDGFYPYCGTVFELSPPKVREGKWTEQILYSFKGLGPQAGFGDGANPNGGLLIDKTGAIYGATQIGGFNCPHNENEGCGTVFRLSPPTQSGGAWTETVIHNFNPDVDGWEPQGGLVADPKGNLYGATLGAGSVFRLSPPSRNESSWTETTLHVFAENAGGYDPEGSLIFDAAGNLFGTTNASAGETSRGTVYRMSPAGPSPGQWSFESLYTFQAPPDGSNPRAGLTEAGKSFYGTTSVGGAGSGCSFYGCGTVFEISP